MDPPRLYQLISGWGYPAAWHDIDALDPRAAVSDSVPPVIIGFAVKILKKTQISFKKNSKNNMTPQKTWFYDQWEKITTKFFKIIFLFWYCVIPLTNSVTFLVTRPPVFSTVQT